MLALVSPDAFVPTKHPIRRIKVMADECLRRLDGELTAMYSVRGRQSIPPEALLKSSLLMALFSVRSERLFCEQLGYNLLYRWFLDMDLTESPFDASSFSKNRERLLEHDIAAVFFHEIVSMARSQRLLSSEEFSVDGTLIEAAASHKSLRARDGSDDDAPPPDDPGNPTVDYRGQRRSNDTHVSKTDPEARLARKGKGKEAKLSYAAHALMENGNGLLVDLLISRTNEHTERTAALEMLRKQCVGRRRRRVAGDKGYDTKGFVAGCRELDIAPLVAQNTERNGGSAIDARTTRHASYAAAQQIRKRIEEIFGWMKTVGGFRRTRFRGRDRTALAAWFVGAAYNLTRLARLMPAG
jgi:transposase